MPAEGLNWRPGVETNSIAVQVCHVVRSVDFYLNAATGIDRDMGAYLAAREDSFHFGADAVALSEMLDGLGGGIEDRFGLVREEDLGHVIDWRAWDRGAVTVAWCVLSVVEHLREHVGAAALTRQLWEQREQG